MKEYIKRMQKCFYFIKTNSFYLFKSIINFILFFYLVKLNFIIMKQLTDKEQKIRKDFNSFYVYKYNYNYKSFLDYVKDHLSFLSYTIEEVRVFELKFELERLKNFS